MSPTQGCDRCECGCKYWEDGRCIDCGDRFHQPQPVDTTTYRGHDVTVLPDGRWRFGPLTFETSDDARYYMNHLPRKATP